MSDAEKVIEPKPVPEGRTGPEELAYRHRQQQVLAEFGRCALAAPDLDVLLNEAVRLCAEGMSARYCKALEYLPEEGRLLIRAGVGWKPGVVGAETLGADMESPAGFAFHTGQPVLSNHLAHEQRFRTPRILAEHGVKRAINVLIATGPGQHWGVLETDSPDEGRFDEADTTFMQGIAHLLGVAIEREETTAALRQSERQFRTIADSLPQLAWITDRTGSAIWFNRRWYEFTGSTPEESLGWGWHNLPRLDLREAVVERYKQAFAAGEPWEDTYPLRGADGRYRWFLSRAEPVHDAKGRITRWVGTNTDITERLEAEELQRTLMQEVSHRVKNSLALVSSLLNVQARTLEGEPRRALEEASLRVRTVARVHDLLWRQPHAGQINLASFLSGLCAAIATTSPQHTTICDVEPAIIPADAAAPIGLLVNEFVTNAYKYAYPPGQEGEVRVTGAHLSRGRYRLTVSDAGQGLPEGFDLAEPGTSLGMRIATALARQLGAELYAENARPGARFTLLLPIEAKLSMPLED